MKQAHEVYTFTQRVIMDAFQSPDVIGHNFAVMDWSLYDRFTMPAGHETPDQIYFYSVPKGSHSCLQCGMPANQALAYAQNRPQFCSRCGSSAIVTKTQVDTNMWAANLLPAPMRFSLNKSLFFLFSDRMLRDDYEQMKENYFFELRLGRKAFSVGPLARFPNACPFDQLELKPFSTPIDDPDLIERNKRWINQQNDDLRQPDFRGRRIVDATTFTVPIVLEWEYMFRLDLVGKPFKAAGDINIMAVMEGLAAMGVQ